MRNKPLLVLLSGLLLIIPALGCITDDSKSTASPITTDIATMKVQIATINTDINNLKTEVNQKADTTRVDALVTAGGIGGTAGYSKTETYTQQQVNDLVAKAISDLKANTDQSWIKVTPVNPTTPGTSPLGTMTATMNPSAITIWSTPYGVGVSGQNVNFTLHMVNSSTQYMYGKPVITLSSNTQLIVKHIYISTNGNGYNMYSTGDINTWSSSMNGAAVTADQIYTISAWNVSSSSIQIQPIKGFNNNAGEVYLAPGGTCDIQVNIANLLTDTNTGTYNITCMVIPHT